jgi:hypothetical protein
MSYSKALNKQSKSLKFDCSFFLSSSFFTEPGTPENHIYNQVIKLIKPPKDIKWTHENYIPTALHVAIAKITLERKAKQVRRLRNLKPII